MDFERARFNMVEQQLRPWNVADQDVRDLMCQVPREDFVPEQYRDMAFSDLEIPLVVDGVATGETMLAPKVEALMLQALKIQRHESVLEIGAGSGFMAALLAQHARHVTTYEILPELARFAAANLRRAGISNVSVEPRDGAALLRLEAEREDAIILSGSVEIVPHELLEKLNVGGRLCAIVGTLPIMHAQLVTRLGEKEFRTERLFDTVAKALTGFPGKPRFTF